MSICLPLSLSLSITLSGFGLSFPCFASFIGDLSTTLLESFATSFTWPLGSGKIINDGFEYGLDDFIEDCDWRNLSGGYYGLKEVGTVFRRSCGIFFSSYSTSLLRGLSFFFVPCFSLRIVFLLIPCLSTYLER